MPYKPGPLWAWNPNLPFYDTRHLCVWCRRPLKSYGWKDGRMVYAQCNCEGARQ